MAEHAAAPLKTAEAVRLISEEIWLREEAGETVDSAELLARFPHLQTELELLLACYGLFQDRPALEFPEAGEELGEFRLQSELGRGATGRVFLATQPSLSDRPVVVKLASLEVAEHLSLSRLQHTGVVPLYLVQDFPERGLRALCMPYLGGASLDAVLAALDDCPAEQRSGRRLAEALVELQRPSPSPLPFESPALELLAGKSYEHAVCWIGACLADALHYAHQRGLLHLDLKPSNVLLAGDGQPMLLDFHLARGPVSAEAPSDSLGGTRGYMSPEQAAAVDALRAGRPVPGPVDVRSDVYSLGRLLYELLGGPADSGDGAPAPPLRQFNRAVPRSLEDLLAKCLSRQPRDRYADAASFAEDLRRHLADLPLVGVPNRSLAERWRKWRRRKPQAFGRLAAGLLLAVACVSLGAYAIRRQAGEARAALENAEVSLARGEYAAAIERLRGGLDDLRHVPGQAALRRRLSERLSDARQLRLGADLHALVDRLRFIDSGASASATVIREIDQGCGALWQARQRLLAQFEHTDNAAEIRTELLDLAILWASLKVRGASEPERAAARRAALELLTEAEESLGQSVVLQRERRSYAAELSGRPIAPAAPGGKAPETVWEHYALGRYLLRGGELDAAENEFQRALDQSPQAFWPNYYAGMCAFRQGRYQQALNVFYACVALAPQSADCFYNRALAHAALEQRQAALDDLRRALKLQPDHADSLALLQQLQ
ncbi:MAG TPA: serine/threonine-protein kinase [Pirellulales bacterium]|nr:serine/threonine-protein kinase [Pirellulales bacterium]